MSETKPGCFEGAVEVCQREICNVAKDCMWRRKPEEGGRGPLIPDKHIDCLVMEGGLPIGR